MSINMIKLKIFLSILILVFSLPVFAIVDENSCSTTGQLQYRPSQYNVCDTETRTCCSNGRFSNWEEKCAAVVTCTSNQCWDGKGCVARPYSTGNQSMANGFYNWTCKCLSPQATGSSAGIGWDCDKTVKCNSGWSVYDESCVKYKYKKYTGVIWGSPSDCATGITNGSECSSRMISTICQIKSFVSLVSQESCNKHCQGFSIPPYDLSVITTYCRCLGGSGGAGTLQYVAEVTRYQCSVVYS